MKSRPRSVERNVAAYLTQLLSDNGKITSPLHRIPVLGREGPDISYDKNVKLIIDVKSRLKVPACMLAGKSELLLADLFCFRLEDLLKLPHMGVTRSVEASKTVRKWWDHMDEWTRTNEPGGISAIVLHRPQMPIGHSTVVISLQDRSKLCHRLS